MIPIWVAQEVFVWLWRQASLWQPGQARFDTWLHRVALNLCYFPQAPVAAPLARLLRA